MLLMGFVNAVKSAIAHYDCLVNCTNNIKRPSHIAPDCYLQLPWEDVAEQDITLHIEATIQKMNHWINIEKKRVLVHCELGISRSGACVLAYLLQYYPFLQALHLLRIKRPIANPNQGFLKQLSLFKKNQLVQQIQ